MYRNFGINLLKKSTCCRKISEIQFLFLKTKNDNLGLEYYIDESPSNHVNFNLKEKYIAWSYWRLLKFKRKFLVNQVSNDISKELNYPIVLIRWR